MERLLFHPHIVLFIRRTHQPPPLPPAGGRAYTLVIYYRSGPPEDTEDDDGGRSGGAGPAGQGPGLISIYNTYIILLLCNDIFTADTYTGKLYI